MDLPAFIVITAKTEQEAKIVDEVVQEVLDKLNINFEFANFDEGNGKLIYHELKERK